MDFVIFKHSIYQGEGVHNYIRPTQIEYLKRLHSIYNNVVDGGGGSGDVGDSAGDSRSVERGHGRGSGVNIKVKKSMS